MEVVILRNPDTFADFLSRVVDQETSGAASGICILSPGFILDQPNCGVVAVLDHDSSASALRHWCLRVQPAPHLFMV